MLQFLYQIIFKGGNFIFVLNIEKILKCCLHGVKSNSQKTYFEWKKVFQTENMCCIFTFLHICKKALMVHTIGAHEKINMNKFGKSSVFLLTTFSKNRPLADSFIESRCPSVGFSVCPLPMGFFSRPLIGPQIT